MFKKGDRVKRIKGNDYPKHNIYRNRIYTVKDCKNSSLWLNECTNYFEPSYFKLIKKNSNYEIY